MVEDLIIPSPSDRITSLNDIILVCAWGSYVLSKERSQDVLAGIESISTMCLGLTKDNQPKHPLHIAYSQDLIPFDIH
jgi:hypothetical protein